MKREKKRKRETDREREERRREEGKRERGRKERSSGWKQKEDPLALVDRGGSRQGLSLKGTGKTITIQIHVSVSPSSRRKIHPSPCLRSSVLLQLADPSSPTDPVCCHHG